MRAVPKLSFRGAQVPRPGCDIREEGLIGGAESTAPLTRIRSRVRLGRHHYEGGTIMESRCPAADLAEDFDPTSPDFRNDRQPVFAELRKGPPRWSSAFGGMWVVSRYEDVVEVTSKPLIFCSSQGTNLPPNGFPYRFPPGEADPPEHLVYRQLSAPFFSPKAVAGLEGTIRTITRSCIDRFISRGSADLASELASHVPPYVIAEMMGFPKEDAELITHLGDRLLETSEQPDKVEENTKAGQEFVAYLNFHIESRKAEPRDDLLTQLVQGTFNERPLTPEELFGLSFFLLIAGHETTVGAIGFMLLHLGRHPEQMKKLRDDRSLITGAIEEALRVDTPVTYMGRTVAEDTHLSGVTMHKGEKVMLLWASANFDESVFEDPEEFSIERPNNRHIAFGSGIHRCQGAAMGRLEMRVVLEEILDAIPDYTVDESGVTIRNYAGVHSVKSLPVSFTPR